MKSPTRALVVNLLLGTGAKIMQDYGAQAVSGMVSFDEKWYKRFLKRKWNAVTLASGNLMMHRMGRI
jgi:hypothetical protein